MADIVIAEFMDKDAVDGLAADYDVLYDRNLVDQPGRLIEVVAGARALIVRNRTQVRGALLKACDSLVCVGRLGVGLDNIDVDACAERGIAVLPATGANSRSVAEYVIAGAMMLLRGAYLSNASMIAGKWPREALGGGREVLGSRLGLIGFGRIARDTATLAKAVGMEVVAYDPNVASDDDAWTDIGVTPASFDDVLATSDVVSLHVPLMAETRHLINAQALATMRANATLINAARGGVVDEKALAAALTDGKLGGAMLDVFEAEPLKEGSRFEGVPNLILTPHIGGLTEQANVRVSSVTAENVRRVLENV